MAGHATFDKLARSLASEREAMTLDELREALGVSQDELAATLQVGQPAVAKLEERSDIRVSNLRRYIEALGGTLEITARFPEASVSITNLGGAPEVR